MEQVNQNNKSIEQFNNSLVQGLGEFYHGFDSYAETVNKVFYFYIQNCIHRNDEITIDQQDVYNVFEVVEFLRKLKYEKQPD